MHDLSKIGMLCIAVFLQKWIFLWKTASVAQVYNRTRQGREIWIIYRGPGLLVVVWFGSSPTLSPPLTSASCLSLSQSPYVSPVELNNVREAGGGGGAKSYDDKKACYILWIIQYSLQQGFCGEPQANVLILIDICAKCTSDTLPNVQRLTCQTIVNLLRCSPLSRW